MKQLKLAVALFAAMTVVGCSSTPEKDPNAGMGDGSGGTAGLGNGALDESALYAGAPSQQNSIIYFGYDSFAVEERYRASLREHAKFMGENPARKVTVEGHADERGSREYNIALGEKRANAVRDVLMLNGVAPAQISVVSYGEERPAVEGTGEEVWRMNRRAELVYGSR
ncbi:MAG: peptidoglycan-associated lipoprotein Pal [Halothiobacillaceae bacterium]|nr:peptidoglycan-associated lipoprotein Pal [Halothiobacillaceae bacterium]